MCNEQRYTESGAPIGPTRCAEYIALKEENARLRDVLQEIEWVDMGGPVGGNCPGCGNANWYGHTPDCIVGNALKEVG